MLVQPIKENTSPRTSSCSATKRAARANRRPRCTSRSRCSRPASASPRSISTRARRASRTTSRTAAPGPSARASSSNCRRISASPRAEGPSVDANEAQEFAGFSQAIGAIEHTHDVVVIDTPGSDTYLMRLAHSMADTLVTPLNDSFVDFDVLGTLDPTTFAVTGESHYAEMVREARRQRRLVDGRLTDWIVVRNRLSTLVSRNKRLVGEGIDELVEAHGVPLRRRFCRTRRLSRIFPARPDRARRSRRGDARHAAEPVARHRARGSHRRCSTRCICRCRKTASAAPRPAPNGIRSWTSRCRSTTSSPD